MEETIKVTVQLTDVLVSIECPHEAVDTDTIHQIALEAIGQGGHEIIPRWNGYDRADGPRFHVFVETIDDPEIQDDDRAEDAPEEFDLNCRWWTDLEKERV